MRWPLRCKRSVEWVPPPVLNVLERIPGFLEIQKCREGFVSTTWKVVHSPELPIVLGILSLSALSCLFHTVPLSLRAEEVSTR